MAQKRRFLGVKGIPRASGQRYTDSHVRRRPTFGAPTAELAQGKLTRDPTAT